MWFTAGVSDVFHLTPVKVKFSCFRLVSNLTATCYPKANGTAVNHKLAQRHEAGLKLQKQFQNIGLRMLIFAKCHPFTVSQELRFNILIFVQQPMQSATPAWWLEKHIWFLNTKAITRKAFIHCLITWQLVILPEQIIRCLVFDIVNHALCYIWLYLSASSSRRNFFPLINSTQPFQLAGSLDRSGSAPILNSL